MAKPIARSQLTVEPAAAGERLDAFLARRRPELSRSRYKALIEAGEVRVGGVAARDPSARLVEGSEVEVALELTGLVDEADGDLYCACKTRLLAWQPLAHAV